MAVRVKAPGSCGELVQGVINGQYFLITCPIELYTEAVTIPNGHIVEEQYTKAQLAVDRTLDYLGLSEAKFQVQIKSQLAVGKGMASSSADISAACQAAAHQAGRKLSSDEIADIALSIEPTDAIFYPGIMMFDHVAGQLRRSLGEPPPMDVLIFDAGGVVDTLAFNKRADLPLLNKIKEPEVRMAADLVIAGMEQGNCRLVAEGATISALANQIILPKPCLERIIKVSSDHGSIGVAAAHSGTVVGVLFPPGIGSKDKCIQDILQHCGHQVEFLYSTRFISGGLLIEEG